MCKDHLIHHSQVKWAILCLTPSISTSIYIPLLDWHWLLFTALMHLLRWLTADSTLLLHFSYWPTCWTLQDPLELQECAASKLLCSCKLPRLCPKAIIGFVWGRWMFWPIQSNKEVPRNCGISSQRYEQGCRSTEQSPIPYVTNIVTCEHYSFDRLFDPRWSPHAILANVM